MDQKIGLLGGYLKEYGDLRDQATQVLGGDGADDNLKQMQENIQVNINAVQGQINLLTEQRAMLQDQMEKLGMLSSDVQSMFVEGVGAAQNLYKTIKSVSDMTG